MTQLVTVDIGGTHARFAIATIADDGAITLGEPQTLHTKDHASFQTAWEDFRARQGGVLPDSVAIAIAGPVGGEVIRFTNNPWVIRPALIPEKLGVSRYTLVNDFGAVGHAVARADAAHLLHLCGPDVPLPDQGAITVIGPGTGLGVAMLLRNPAGYHVQSTEGGHIDFAPHDVIEDAILTRLRQRHNRVSVERVVSGPAIVDIYQALANLEGRAVLERGDVELWTAGTDGSDSLAAAAVDRFCMALGSAAGDFALAHGATGVVVAGGLGYRIRDALKNSAFARRFEAKGRFAGLMAAMPVKLIIHPQPGLFGAAAAFAGEHLP
ncbi:glucokinase [Novosphingobium fluoreni]|uniref:Glucokinase n=1 Tax=Novosphingobium fluoreni TaxID=1391222 RepID=A0A7W6FY60_9SPHN|nr:glucokinase [Novosphingobium fluoreni]MBB3939886.1 glucokinase [Novosphingobium fluoreni]